MTARYFISEQDRQTLKRLANQVGLSVSESLPARPPVLPTLARSTEAVAVGAESSFDLLEGFPLIASGVLRTARNICSSSIANAQDVLLHYLAVEGTNGFWGAVPCSVQQGGSSSCTCELIDLLAANNNLSDITTTEWNTLRTSCECGVECSNCDNSIGPNQFSVTVSGVTVSSVVGTTIPIGDQQAARDWFNDTHVLNYQGSCVWRKSFNYTGGVNLTFTVEIDVGTDDTNAELQVSGDGSSLSQYSLSHTGTDPDCLSNLALTFDTFFSGGLQDVCDLSGTGNLTFQPV